MKDIETKKFNLQFKSVLGGKTTYFELKPENLKKVADTCLSNEDLENITLKSAFDKIFDWYTCELSWDDQLLNLGFTVMGIENQKEFLDWIYSIVTIEYIKELSKLVKKY